MALPEVQMWRWILVVCFNWICVKQVVAGPQYMVAIPAVLEAGSEARFCVSLMQPNETLVTTITLISDQENTTVFRETSSTAFHRCAHFQAPAVKRGEVVQTFKVEVRGETFQSTEQRKVMIKAYDPATFVQTDKPIYLPGQTVHFRVISLDSKFRPSNELYNIVEIADARRNRIAQWVNVTSNGKILQRSYSLNSEAPEGSYQVVVSIGEKKIYHSFKVEKYVLPKFEVKVKATEEISVEQEEFTAEVCATYTYGQPVPGAVGLTVCRPLLRHIAHYVITAPCHKETQETDETGCATFTIRVSTFTKAGHKFLTDQLSLAAEVEEQGTGVSQTQGKTIKLSYVVGKLSFIETPKVYESGTTVEGKVKAVHLDDTPVADRLLHLFEGFGTEHKQNLTTDGNGIASFSFNTTGRQGDIRLIVSTKQTTYPEHKTSYYEDGRHTLSLVQLATSDTKTVSSLEVKSSDKPLPCGGEVDVTIQYSLVGEVRGSVDVMYLILSRAAIISQGHMKAEVQGGPVTEGEVSFKMEVSPEMAPIVQVVAYAVLPSETVIAHSKDFPTEKCFSHKVSVEFSPSTAVPGEENTLRVSAQPGSLCGISAVDQSVLIKEPGKKLDADKIFHLLPVEKATSIPHEVEDAVECLRLPARPRRYVMPYPGHRDDAFSVFQNLGLKVATNLLIRIPSCLEFKGRQYYFGRGGGGGGIYSYRTRMMQPLGSAGVGGGYSGSPPPLETVRVFFPETWIWDLVEVGASGVKDVSLTVPDTITTWETEAFCLSSQGFGLAPSKELTVFQPFFLELSLPYSIIRGEHFELKATVFNYLSSCIMVTVTPTPSLDYTLTALSGDQYSACLCANGRRTLSWTMAPTVLGVVNVTVTAEAVASHASCDNEIVNVPERGRIDVVTRSLVVKAEGTEQTDTYTWLLCPKGETLKEDMELQLPEDVIDGSDRASISVLGDILGRALQNLDGLLKMPYGCGEQNMALLAPNIYILEYLRNTHQLTPAIEKKATHYLSSGYQRQLNYKHHDGAFSTFGQGSGNSWLTAFVLRSFDKARSFIYIDPLIIDQSKTWLEGKQRRNGCFQEFGRLFNNRMKGGVSDEVTLTAYITASLLEMNVSVSNPVLSNSLSCLRNASSDVSNTYTTALLAYTFTLAGDMETRARLLKHLDNISSQQGGLLHWSQTSSETSASLSVEISSYVLLATLSASPTTADKGYASRIVRWLAGQQNSYGGFSSTQDTVVALQALALYSSLVFSPEGSSTVTVQSPGGQLTFDVNQGNKLLYQERALQDTTGAFSLEVKGTACASVQVAHHYNIPTPTGDATLSIQVTPEADCTSNSQRPKLTLKLKSLYSGVEPHTNMIIVDMKMLSGFVPDAESLKKLRGALLVDRVDREDDHVIVYLKELPSIIPIYHTLEIVQELPVQNLKPAVVKIYDYYQTSDRAETEYNFPCAAGV